MEIKGNIGDKVWVKATVNKILISEDKTEYSVKLDVNDISFFADEEDIKFEQDEEQPEELPEQPEEQPEETITVETESSQEPKESPIDINCSTCAYTSQRGSEHPCDVCDFKYSEWKEKKKRGRPKKATVEDLMKRCREIRQEKEKKEEKE